MDLILGVWYFHPSTHTRLPWWIHNPAGFLISTEYELPGCWSWSVLFRDALCHVCSEANVKKWTPAVSRPRGFSESISWTRPYLSFFHILCCFPPWCLLVSLINFSPRFRRHAGLSQSTSCWFSKQPFMSASLPSSYPLPHSLVFYSSLCSPFYSTSLSPSSIRFSRSITLPVRVPFISPSACPTCWQEFFLPPYCISLLSGISLLTIHLQVLRPSPSLPPSLPLSPALPLSLLSVRLAVESLSPCWQCCLCELSAELHSPLASHWPPPSHHYRCRLPSSSSTFPPFLIPHLLLPTLIPLQAGELTSQPWAPGLNDSLLGQLLTSGPHTRDSDTEL